MESSLENIGWEYLVTFTTLFIFTPVTFTTLVIFTIVVSASLIFLLYILLLALYLFPLPSLSRCVS
jgi:hypothetical protein